MREKMKEKYIRVIKGSAYFSPSFKKRSGRKGSPKTIAFDLDETIGSFGDLYLLWICIETYIQHDIHADILFRELLD